MGGGGEVLPSRETYPDSQNSFDVAKIGIFSVTYKFSVVFFVVSQTFRNFASDETHFVLNP